MLIQPELVLTRFSAEPEEEILREMPLIQRLLFKLRDCYIEKEQFTAENKQLNETLDKLQQVSRILRSAMK